MAEHTPGPWVQFSDQGKCVAIMPAGREGDICTFDQSPSDEDARLMTLAPSLLKALQLARKRIEYLGSVCRDSKHFEANDSTYLPAIDGVLAAVVGQAQASGGGDGV
jgi:hypothetical protein